MAQSPDVGPEAFAFRVTVLLEMETTNDAVGTVAHDPPLPLPVGARPSTATVADDPIWKPLPRNPLMSGVRKPNCSATWTVTVLPWPVPPGAAEQAMALPAVLAQ